MTFVVVLVLWLTGKLIESSGFAVVVLLLFVYLFVSLLAGLLACFFC